MRNSSLSKLEIMREAGSLPDGNVLLGRPDSYQALQEVLGICFTLRQLQQSGGINRIPSPSQNKEYQSVRTHAILDLIIDLLLLQDKLRSDLLVSLTFGAIGLPSAMFLLIFTCRAARWGQKVRVVGSTLELGSWNPPKAPALRTEEQCAAECKFVIDTWEDRSQWEDTIINRFFSFSSQGQIQTTSVTPQFGVAVGTAPQIAGRETCENCISNPVIPDGKVDW